MVPSATNWRLATPCEDRGLGARSVPPRAVLALIERETLNKSRVITVGSAVAVLALTAGTASAATTFITSGDIKDGTIRKVDLNSSVSRALVKAQEAPAGTVYRVAHYPNGANGTAIGTVACADTNHKSQKYIAIAGGMQILNADGDLNSANDSAVAVADSFPGRMDWSTSSPKDGRLDGWIVRWGNAAESAAQVNVWAVCMKRPANLDVETTTYQ
jgi:hypothetical protein